jgi:GTPase SAR1 family protein
LKNVDEALSITFIGDNPIIEGAEDGLGFEDYASVLTNCALSSDTPLSIGIFGDWGTGKTSLMNLIKRNIESTTQQKAVTIWFNAWQYESEMHPVIPLCGAIIAQFKAQKSILGNAFVSLERALRAVAYGFSLKAEVGIPFMGKVEAELSTKDVISREERLRTDKILEQSSFYNSLEMLNEASRHLGDKRVIVFIDDLDRCFPENAVKLLESIKLILYQPNFLFILGLDKKTISSFVSQKYEGFTRTTGDEYLDKLFQIAFFIPDYSHLVANYATMLVESHLDSSAVKEFGPLLSVIGLLCRNNPRAVKRFLNNMLIDKAITLKRVGIAHIPLVYFGLARALQMHWPIVADAIRYDDDRICEKLSKNIYSQGRTAIETIEELASDESNVNVAVYRLILYDRSLRSLIISEATRKWLTSDSDTRKTCWSMLQESIPVPQLDRQSEVGNRFINVMRGQILNRGSIYSTVIRSGWCKEKVQKLFPDLFECIVECADQSFWGKVPWSYAETDVGVVLGWIVHPNGSKVYLMEFECQRDNVYLLVNETGVKIIDG